MLKLEQTKCIIWIDEPNNQYQLEKDIWRLVTQSSPFWRLSSKLYIKKYNILLRKFQNIRKYYRKGVDLSTSTSANDERNLYSSLFIFGLLMITLKLTDNRASILIRQFSQM
jgi:hypothetical protein